jgi:predicted O-methyltransferase YrrM
MIPVINEIYETADRNLRASAITPAEGELIHRAISENQIERTIEVGCAYGLSSLFICSALMNRPNPHHVIIDPFQTSAYNGQGISNLRRAGISFFELIEQPSELALPVLLEQEAVFDFALIDGFHTFDHTLLDFFYLNRMLRVGGLIAFDDNNMAGVHKVIRYVANYPSYRLFSVANVRGTQRRILNAGKRIVGTLLWPLTRMMGDDLSHELFDDSLVHPNSIPLLDYSTMVIFKKIDEDKRGSEWYAYF